MTFTTKTRAIFFTVFITLPVQALADFELLAGKWERSLTTYMFVHSTNTYAPWEHPMSSSCYSEAALKKLGFLSSAGSKLGHEKDGRSCEVSEEKISASSASWRLQCRSPGGVIDETRISLVTSSTEIHSSSVLRVTGKEDALGPDGMSTELVMRRVGECEEKSGNKNEPRPERSSSAA